MMMATVALSHIREKHPILVGGFAGKEMGDFGSLLSVYIIICCTL